MNDPLDPILQQEEQRKLRTQLMWRLGIASLLVGGVLGVLGWLEQEPDNKPQMSVNTPREVRIATLPASTTLSASTPSHPEVASQPLAASAPQIASLPAMASIPVAAVNPPPASTPTTVTPRTTAEPDTKSSTSKPETAAFARTISKPIAPQVMPPTAPSKPAEPVAPVIAGKPFEPTKPTQTARLIAPEKTTHQPAATLYPQPISSPNGFTVQAGVFLHAANAEKMLKQVQVAGIPAYMETRVQIGPFKNRLEAEAAVQKLRKLGIEPVIKEN